MVRHVRRWNSSDFLQALWLLELYIAVILNAQLQLTLAACASASGSIGPPACTDLTGTTQASVPR